MSISVIIPVFNEEKQIFSTLKKLKFIKKKIKKYEIIFIDDFSTDKSFFLIKKHATKNNHIKIFRNRKKGLGSAIETGIKKSKNYYICFFMCDLSDDIRDLIKYYNIIKKYNKIDAVFGSRFLKNSKINNYPIIKLLLNRFANNIIRLCYFSKYNDFTNAFKIYKKNTLLKLFPLISESFNIFLEIPLKIINRKYNYKIIPINWYGRKKGNSKFNIEELGSMYIFTLLYCLIEKILLMKKK